MAEFNGEVGHLSDIESPWANAGGVVKTVEDVEGMAHTGVGWIEAGSYTLEPRAGNGPKGERVYYHNSETGETFNSLGMPNKGLDVVEVEIPEMVRIAHDHDMKLVVNVAPVSSDPAKESLDLVRRAHNAGADAVLLNAGCPNVVTEDGGRHELLSRSPGELYKVLTHLKMSLIDTPDSIWLRISPQESYKHMMRICDIIKSSGMVSAVLTPNTWPGHVPKDEAGKDILQVQGGIGGKSGPATKRDSEVQVVWADTIFQGTKTDVIRSSGIMDAPELKRSLALGAIAGAGTTFYYESQNGWQEDTDKLLYELAS